MGAEPITSRFQLDALTTNYSWQVLQSHVLHTVLAAWIIIF
jgi:hypothetical protein